MLKAWTEEYIELGLPVDVYKRQMSLWSPLMSKGPDTVRQATLSTIGNRVPD